MAERILKDVELSKLSLSRFNARHTRPTASVTALAERMRRNGFESTRALWAYPGPGDTYEVFAGGTRLAAAREAHIPEVPVLVHEGYDEGAISRLADEDNANDEYHVPVPLPDVWAEYKRLKDEEEWTQQKIAEAKGVPQQRVAERQHYAEFPDKVLRSFTQNDFLKESHALEMSKLHNLCNLSPWLTRDEALTEILAAILLTHRGGSGGIAPTATVFAAAVKTWNGLLEAATSALASFPESVDDQGTRYTPRGAFLAMLAAQTVRTTKDVLAVASAIASDLQAIQHRHIAALAENQRRLTEEQQEAQRHAHELEARRERHAYRDKVLRCFQHGDCHALIPAQCPSDIRLVLTDPPYGKQFRSQRRVTTEKKAVVQGDASLTEASALLAGMLTRIRPHLAQDCHLFIFTHQDGYPAFCHLLENAGFTLRRTMTWVKGNHGMGDVTRGEALTETEWVIHAVQGNPKLTEGISRHELLDFPGLQDSSHPMEKPVTLLRHLIQRATEPGQLVVDPFAGTGNTLLATLAEQRWGWACEIDDAFYREGAEKLYQSLGDMQEVL